MQRLKQSGSLYYIYKGFYSLVLKAISDANYCFMQADIGQYRSRNDRGVSNNFQMKKGFENDIFDIPSPSKVPGIEDLPLFLVGCEAFPLKFKL